MIKKRMGYNELPDEVADELELLRLELENLVRERSAEMRDRHGLVVSHWEIGVGLNANGQVRPRVSCEGEGDEVSCWVSDKEDEIDE